MCTYVRESESKRTPITSFPGKASVPFSATAGSSYSTHCKDGNSERTSDSWQSTVLSNSFYRQCTSSTVPTMNAVSPSDISVLCQNPTLCVPACPLAATAAVPPRSLYSCAYMITCPCFCFLGTVKTPTCVVHTDIGRWHVKVV